MSRTRKMLLIGLAAIIFVVAGLAIYLNSASFHDLVRRKIVTQLEDMTGGTVELRSISWQLRRLDFVIEDLTIHGTEPPEEKPYAHIDRLEVRAKIISLIGRQIGLRYLSATRPAIHIIVRADGTTNQPTPKIRKTSDRSPIDELFDLAIDEAEAKNGELLWNDRKLPLDFHAENVSLRMTFDAAKQVYTAEGSVSTALAKYDSGSELPIQAEAKVDLHRNAAHIEHIQISTPHSRIAAHGSVDGLSDPKIAFDYEASLDVPELGRATAMRQLTSGKVNLRGTGRMANGSFSSQGRLQTSDLSYRDANIALDRVTLATPFTFSPEEVTLPAVHAQLLGGMVTGNVRVEHWGSKPGGPGPPQTGVAHIALAGVDMQRVLAALSSRALPLARLNAVGATSGNVNASWRGTPANAVAELDLTTVAPANVSPDRIPLNGHIAGRFNAATSSLELAAANLSTRALQVSASGAIGRRDAELRFNASASSLKELEPLLAGMGKGANVPANIPLDVHGQALVHGVLRGTLAQPHITGDLQVSDFDLRVAGKKLQTIHWDQLAAAFDYLPSEVSVRNGRLRRGQATIAFDGKTSLQRGSFTDRSVFALNANVDRASLQELQELAGYNYPVTGILRARLNVQGTKKDMRGGASLEVTQGTAYSEPFKDLRATFVLAGQQVQLRELTISQNGARLNAAGTYNLQSKAFTAQLHGRNIDLAHIQRIQSARLSLQGAGSFDASASGDLDRPVVQADLDFGNIIANGEHIGDIHAKAVTVGREMRLTFRSQLEEASLSADGTVQLAGQFPANLTVHFENLDFDPVLRAYFQDRVTGHSSMNGRIEITGPAKQPKSLRVHAVIPKLSAQIEKITLANAEPIEFTYADQIATVESLHLTGDGTDLQATGHVDVASQELDLRAHGDVNLKLAEGFSPGLLSYGTVNMQMAVRGTIKQPRPTGQIVIRDAGVSVIDLPNGLAGINGTLVFNQDRLQVRSLTANTGGGKLDIGGFISYQNGVYFDLTATGQDVRLRYPPGVSASADANLRYSGTLKSSLLSGDVLVNRFGINPRFDFALYVARGSNPPTAPKANPLLDNMRLDIHVTSAPELRVETQLAKISGDVDLRIRGTASRPAVLGRVNIAEGDIFFNSTKYHLERGDITFSNPVRIQPILNVEASARVREYDITLGFHGPIDRLSTTYRSEPPLPTADIIALLALGRTREDAVLNPPVQQNFAETASNAILGQALDAAVSSRVQKLFGVSRIKIDPQVGGPETATGARITIEQQVSNNVTLTYITNVARANQQVIQGEFNFTRNVSLVIVRDENGVLGFDVRIRQRVK